MVRAKVVGVKFIMFCPPIGRKLCVSCFTVLATVNQVPRIQTWKSEIIRLADSRLIR